MSRPALNGGVGFRILLSLFLLWCVVVPMRADEPANVQVRVTGGYWLENRRMVRMLHLLKSDAAERPAYDAADVEDAALILVSRLNEEGFLAPTVAIRLTQADGSTIRESWDEELHTRLPRDLQATRVHFRIRRGVRFHFEHVTFDGLTALSEAEARRFFMSTDFLLRPKASRIYTPGRLANGARTLREALHDRGYEDAQVTVQRRDQDYRKGRVRAHLVVLEGRRSVVHSVRTAVVSDALPPSPPQTNYPNMPYSRWWEQNRAHDRQREFHRVGFPEARVTMSRDLHDPDEATTLVDIDEHVETGERVRLGEVRFTGATHTRDGVMERRARLAPGDWLDRVAAEQGRFRLSRLGIFDTVELSYDPTNGPVRDAVYHVREGRRQDISLLLGYGSYELLRGGFEWEQRNLFGLAHRSRLRMVQSFKSTSADYGYIVPDLLAPETDVFVRGAYLRREEADFIRREYGGSVGAQRFLQSLQSHGSLRFNYEQLQARDSEVSEDIGPQDATVSAWLVELARDRRDNPLTPRRGYNVALRSETAVEAFGGNVNYQRFELSGSYHHRLGGGRWLHLGVTHGVALPFDSAREDLPFNKRFFPGGENSVRGYQHGEAAPLDAEGRVIGAEAFLLGNVELEQALAPQWSLVVFCDAVGLAERSQDYPFSEGLYSVGGGLRWQTVVGPVRLEYGYNLNRRTHDPVGTLHFSIGFPF